MVVNQRRKELSLNTVINGQRQAIKTKRAAQNLSAVARSTRNKPQKNYPVKRIFARKSLRLFGLCDSPIGAFYG